MQWKFTTFSKILIFGLIGLSLWSLPSAVNWLKQNPHGIFFLIYGMLGGIAFININKYIIEPFKKWRKRKKLISQKRLVEKNIFYLETQLHTLSMQLEREVSRPGVSEEFQMQYVDRFLQRKTAIEIALRASKHVVQTCTMGLEFELNEHLIRNNEAPTLDTLLYELNTERARIEEARINLETLLNDMNDETSR